jgi:hypothetical protein
MTYRATSLCGSLYGRRLTEVTSKRSYRTTRAGGGERFTSARTVEHAIVKQAIERSSPSVRTSKATDAARFLVI